MAVQQGRSAFTLEYPQHLAYFDDYREAQRAVDFLSDERFPVENCLIVGTDLKQIERVTGRMTTGKAAGYGAASGAWIGLLLGLIVGIFAEPGNWLAIVVSATGIGLLFGLVWGLIGYAFTRGQRDFTSVAQVIASRYELLVEHRMLAEAQQTLAGLIHPAMQQQPPPQPPEGGTPPPMA